MGIFTRFFRKRGAKPRILNMVLDHDGQQWVASGEGICVQAPTLKALDRKVADALAGEHSQDRPIEVFMASNNEMIPMWMRPYMNHYFNRILELPLRG